MGGSCLVSDAASVNFRLKSPGKPRESCRDDDTEAASNGCARMTKEKVADAWGAEDGVRRN